MLFIYLLEGLYLFLKKVYSTNNIIKFTIIKSNIGFIYYLNSLSNPNIAHKFIKRVMVCAKVTISPT
jgi:hypothetical protein